MNKFRTPKGICAFSEIAKLYYPNISKASASRKLRIEIERCPPLIEQLREIGYSKQTKELTPAHKQLIFKYIGEIE